MNPITKEQADYILQQLKEENSAQGFDWTINDIARILDRCAIAAPAVGHITKFNFSFHPPIEIILRLRWPEECADPIKKIIMTYNHKNSRTSWAASVQELIDLRDNIDKTLKWEKMQNDSVN